MSKQTINVGSAANDGTGTPTRTAFQYVNANFTELYNAVGGSNGTIPSAIPISKGGTGATTASDARSNLGLGDAATKNTGTSGAAVPLLNGTNTWSSTQTFSVAITVGGSATYPGVRFIAQDTVEPSTIGFSTTLESSVGNQFYISYRDKAESNTGRVTIYFPRTSGTLALATSDERIKDKISFVDEEKCLDRLKKLELWNYTMKKGMNTNPEMDTHPKRGFMAQQANSVDPAYALPPNSDDDYWGIDDRAIIADLVGAIRILKQEIDELKGM